MRVALFPQTIARKIKIHSSYLNKVYLKKPANLLLEMKILDNFKRFSVK